MKMDGGDTPLLIFDDNERALRAGAERARLQGAHSNEEATSVTPPKWPEPLSPQAFYGLAGEYVSMVEPASETDNAALLLQFLVATGNAIGHRPHFLAEDTPHYVNIYAVLVGLTSKSRKGTSWNRVKRALTAIDERWALHCVSSGLSSGEGLIEAVRDEDDKGQGGVTDKRLLISQGEFCGVLKVMERDGNILSTVLRDAWDGVQLRTMTRKANALRSNGAHISLVGHITRDELRSALTETDKANGFANRILWACIRRSKELPDPIEISQAAWAALISRLTKAIDFARTVELMSRNEDAKVIWRKVYHELSEGHPGMFGAVTSRGEAQVVRLSCLYALLDQKRVVEADHLAAALELWRYCEDSARYCFGDQLGDPVADAILAALRESDSGLTRTDLMNLFGRHKSADRLGVALDLLQERGLVASRKECGEGRPTEVWFAVSAKEAKEAK